MNDKTITEVAPDSPHVLRSMLACLPDRIELPTAAAVHRCFVIRAADSHRERRSASSLVERMYATRGYHRTSPLIEESPHRRTFLATEHGVPIGTLTIDTASVEDLVAHSLFPDSVGPFRDAGRRICEFTKLAMDRGARSPRLLASLFHVAYLYAHRIKDLTHLVIEVNPRHVKYYETMLGFEVISAARHNPHVNAPAVLLSLDFSYAEEQIRIFGGKPEMATTERSAYPHFFSVKDEAGILGRLHETDIAVAHVFESVPCRSAPPLVDNAAH